MTISVEANGLTFSFPDGTTTEQIGEAIDGYFIQNPPQKPERETWVTDLEHGAGELLDHWIHEGVMASPATADLMAHSEAAGIHPTGAAADALRGDNAYAKMTPEPTGFVGNAISFLPGLATAGMGWEAGLDGLAESGLQKGMEFATSKLHPVAEWIVDKGLKGMAGTLGSDIVNGEDPTNLVNGGAANVAMETVFHTPQALRFMKTLLAKNGGDIWNAAAHIGVNPSMGVTTSREWLRTLENWLNKAPGGHLLNIHNAKSLKTMDSFVRGIKSKLGYKGDASELGREIHQAIETAEKQFEDEAEKLYDKVYQKVGKYQKTNTRRFVREVEQMFGVVERPGMTEMTAPPVVRKYMKWIDQAGKKPTNSGYSNLPMNLSDARKILKHLDDYIGTGESADADTAAAKMMAKALRADITGAFDALGHGEQWKHVQSFYAEGLAMLNQARNVLGRAETGDAIYTRLFGNESGVFSPKGVDTLKGLKAVMNPEEWRHVAAEVVHRMGLESAGQAAAEGRAFAPSTFLTNWNKLNPQARELLFGVDHAYDLEQLAKLSEGFKNLGRDANHSNTAHHMAIGAHIAHIAASPLSGILTAFGATSGAALMAKLLINPEATKLLVDASHAVEPNQVQQWIIRAVALAAANPELSDALATLGNQE